MAAQQKTADKTAAKPMQMDDPSTAGKELTVHQGGDQPKNSVQTPAQRQREKLEHIIKEMKARQQEFEVFLAAHGISFDFFVAVVRRALVKTPSLYDCTTASILQACLSCAMDGLMPDGKDAAITPFKKTATYVPMYQGMLKVAYKVTDPSGHLVYQDIEVDVVYEGEEDNFEYRRGDGGFIHFSPPLDRDISKPIAGAYCIIRTTNGGVYRTVMGQKELRKVRAVSKAQNGPNAEWPGEMAKKAPLRRCLKITPRNSVLDAMLTRDEDSYLPGGANAADNQTPVARERIFDDKEHDPAEDQVDVGDEGGEGDEDQPSLTYAQQMLVECNTVEEIDETLGYIEKAPEFLDLTGDDWTNLRQNADIMKQRLGGDAGDKEVKTGEVIQGEPKKKPAAKKRKPEPEPEPQDETPHDPETGEVIEEGGDADPDPEPTPELPAQAKAVTEIEKITPAQAALEGGFYQVKTDKPNGNGQRPYYDPEGRERGWCGEMAGIDLLDAHPVREEAEQDEPEIRRNPEDRQEPDEGQDDGGDDSYGDEEGEAVEIALRLKVSPKDDAKVYSDAAEWMNHFLTKMNALKPEHAPLFWKDNMPFVIEGIPMARREAGRILAQAVVKRLPGAKEAVQEHGPF